MRSEGSSADARDGYTRQYFDIYIDALRRSKMRVCPALAEDLTVFASL